MLALIQSVYRKTMEKDLEEGVFSGSTSNMSLPPPPQTQHRNAKIRKSNVRNGHPVGSARVIHPTCTLIAGHHAACAIN